MENLFTDFVPIRSKAEILFFRHFFWIIPSVYLFRSFVEWLDHHAFPYNLLDYIKTSTELLLILALYLSLRLFRTLGPKLHELFRSPAITEKEGNTVNRIERDLDKRLNCRIRITFGVFFFIAILTYYLARVGGLRAVVSSASFSLSFVDFLLYFLPPALYGYFVGTLVWRFVVLIHFLSSIPKYFEVKPVFSHPDKAGGLDAVGYISTQILFVALVPTIASAVTLSGAVIYSLTDIQIPAGNEVLIKYFSPLILLASLVGIVSGLLPILAFRFGSKNNPQDQIRIRNNVSSRIISLKKDCLERIGERDFDHSSALASLHYLESIYDDFGKTLTWPLSRHRIKGITALFGYYVGQVAASWGFLSGLMKVSG